MSYHSEMDALLQQLEAELTKINHELEQPLAEILRLIRPPGKVIDLEQFKKDNKTKYTQETEF